MKLKVYYLTLLIFISIITGCKESSNPVYTNNPPTLPTLSDPIPYENLGQGKIVFERIGPLSNNYSGGYVIDINNRKSWDIYSGVFDGPSISPDGKLVAFSTLTSYHTYYDIYTVNIDGSNKQQITAMSFQEKIPSWSSNGEYIFHYSWIQSQGMGLYKTSLNSHQSTVLFTLLNYSENRTSNASDGRILYSDYNNIKVWHNNSIKTLLSDSSIAITLHSPTYNPQGDKIAYIETTTDSMSSIYKKIKVMIMDSNGGNLITLVELNMYAQFNWSGSNNLSLCWSPDGSKIAFNKPESDLCAHIYVINSNGTNLIQVTSAEGVADRSISWSN